MPKSAEEHARNWDLRHEDFHDHDLLYEVYSVMRQQAPIAHTAAPFFPTDGAWVALGYDECYRIAQDWQHFSSNPTPEGARQAGGDLVITLDPPRQQKFRKVLNPYFSPARMKALTPQIRAETDLLIDGFIEQGVGDLAQVAWQQPGVVFFKYLLGMPVGDVPLCLDLVDAALNGDTEQDRMMAWGGLYQHVHDAVSARATAPGGDDMIDVLLHAEIDGDPLPFNDIVANAILLVQAGLETTASAMSFAFHYLATHPAERDRLIAEPEILPRAVEEFIRFAGSIHSLPRTVAGDVELGAHRFAPGDTVLLNYAAANRDAAQFPDPDRCVLDRSANRHLGFGAGVHRCLGSNLARLEFAIGLEQVLARMPDMALDPTDSAVFHGNSVTRGYRRIPVVFTGGEPSTVLRGPNDSVVSRS
ncbi:cytochrome [Mycobacterium sp. E802]|uniref:cytochrome P450 n=1 Tax=Mycobacterium sp. E802 TaxID=1834152 RepID=UPI0007FE098F|nr:cytochrome P450 [Mycobacterium sp. E802]OBG79780.1 cytochrome [Mycobacterium sp. E802]